MVGYFFNIFHLLDKSIYPFSLSTRNTITGSILPTYFKIECKKEVMMMTMGNENQLAFISFETDLILRLVSSESRIIPSTLLYSRSCTYAPISATRLT